MTKRKGSKPLFLRLAEFYADNMIEAMKNPQVPEWRVKAEASLAAHHALCYMLEGEGHVETEQG